MLIDCDTCTARGTGCADCVVTVLLGAPPGWQTDDPVVVSLADRTLPAALEATEGVVVPPPRAPRGRGGRRRPPAGGRRGVRRGGATGRPGAGGRRAGPAAAAPARQ